MPSKYDKLLPNRKQNQALAKNAAKSHRDHLFSGKNVRGNKTIALENKYYNRKKRIRGNAKRNADFYLSGTMFNSIKENKGQTTKNQIVYNIGSYLRKEDLNKGLGFKRKDKKPNHIYTTKKNPAPESTIKEVMKGYKKHLSKNIRDIVMNRKDIKLTLKF